MLGGSLGYSGAIKDSDVPSFAGLAQIGDRLTRFYLTFYSGSTVNDALGTAPAGDFRAIEYVPDDSSSCSVGRSTARHDAFLAMVGLGLVGLLLRRRRR
jgi:MYXO-CTERM domain-containing protein